VNQIHVLPVNALMFMVITIAVAQVDIQDKDVKTEIHVDQIHVKMVSA
jgi:hypothetical protein